MSKLIYEDEIWTVQRYGPFIYEVTETNSGTKLMDISISLSQFDTEKKQDDIIKEIIKNLKI